MRAALITHCPPEPPWTGERRRVAAWLNYLSGNYRCDVLLCRRSDRRLDMVRRKLSRPLSPPHAARFAVPEQLRTSSGLDAYDVIVVFELWALSAVPRRVWPRVIWDKDTLMGSSYATSGDLRARAMSHWVRAFETSALKRVRHAFLSMPEDVAALDLPNVGPLPHGFDQQIRQVGWAEPRNRPVRLGFVGLLGHLPNLEGLGWFIDEVLPRLRSSDHLQATELWIAGGGLPTEARERFAGSPGVRLLGYVPDLREFYESIDLAVAPLLRGQGAPTKVIEALGYGVPVVGPGTALRGLAPELRGACFETTGSDWEDPIRSALAARADLGEMPWRTKYTWSAVMDRHVPPILEMAS